MASFGARRGDEQLIAALATGLTVEAAARQAGLSRRTGQRRWADPAIKEAVGVARAELLRRAVAALSATATRAVVTLARLLDADDERVRLGAARATLDLALKGQAQLEFEQRLAVLEQRLADGEAGRVR